MDIADGLAWLHMHKIIHSDLKTQVTTNGPRAL